MLTLDELKVEANRLGYRLVKKTKKEKLIPCLCGRNSRNLWFDANERIYIYECRCCGKRVTGQNESDLRRQWNKMIVRDRCKMCVHYKDDFDCHNFCVPYDFDQYQEAEE